MLEYGELRFTFNERDFAERCEQAARKLGFVDGELALCDEVLTPDSSRFWPVEAWAPGSTPPSLDKQPVRDWLDTTGWDKAPPPPSLPPEVVESSRRRYVDAYERVTGLRFADWYGVTVG